MFEKFFADIPVSTTDKPISSTTVAELLLKESVHKCNVDFKFEPVNSRDIIKTFKSLDTKKTSDLWGISVKLISHIIDAVAPHLATIFNNCIEYGVFPDLMKFSKVIPIFKSGSTSDLNNFRPVSILPSFSKIFEKKYSKSNISAF